MDTHWFSFKRKGLKRASANLGRVAGASLMLAGLLGPATMQPQKAEAGLMNWERGTTIQKTSDAPFTGVPLVRCTRLTRPQGHCMPRKCQPLWDRAERQPGD